MNALFDLDGVILDTERIYIPCWLEAAATLGYDLTREQALSLRSLDRQDGRDRFKRWFGLDADIDEVKAKRDQLMESIAIPVKEGVLELIEYLKGRGIAYAICTSSTVERAYKKLEKAGIAELFPTVISAINAKRGKPHPEPYLLALEQLGFDKDDTICVEDSPNGFHSAYASGCRVIFDVDLTKPDEDIAKKATIVIHTLRELIPFFEAQK